MSGQADLKSFYGLSNMMIPREGPRTVPATLVFDASGEIDIDGLLVTTNGVIGFVQGVFIDNADNALPFHIVCSKTQQRIICPANSQGYFTLLLPNPPDTVARLIGAIGGERVTLHFYNVPIQSGVWAKAVSGGTGSNAPNFTNYGAAMIGVNQTLITAGAALRYLAVQNPTGNGPVTVNIAGGDASVSGIVLQGGGSITLESGLTNAVNVRGTAGQTIIAFGGV